MTKSPKMSKTDDLMTSISDATIASMTAKWGMGGGTATSIFGWFTANNIAVIIGIIVTLAGFILNALFQYKREKRAKEEHDLRMKLLEMEYRTKLNNVSKHEE